MATLSKSLGHVKAHLEDFLSTQDILTVSKEQGHKWRKRLLDPAVTVQLFLIQLLAKVAMSGLRHAAKIEVTAQAICKAKKRLPLGVLMELV
jgi:hypothetical protein